MGLVKRHGFFNSIMIYAGLVMGYVNTIFLYPRAISVEDFGIFQLLLSVALLFSQLSSSSVSSIISRYFPYYRSEDKKHKGFVELALVAALIVFAFFSILFLLFKGSILAYFNNQSNRFYDYQYYILPLAFFILWYNIFEVLARAVYRTIFAAFLKEFVVKFGTAIALVLIIFGHLDFDGFIVAYLSIYGLICLFLLIQLIRTGEFKFSKTISLQEHHKKEFLQYGAFTLLAGTPWVIIQQIDKSILQHYSAEAVVGGYAYFVNIASAIVIPRNAMNRISYQIVVDAWAEENMKKMADIYNKTSIVQLVLGLLFFAGILLNKDNLFAIIKNKEYLSYFPLFYLIGLAQLVDITGGLNAHIIFTSPRYRTGTYLVLTACILCVILNVWFIPVYGGMGAALAYLITIFLFNASTWWYLRQKYSFQPFSFRHLLAIVFIAIAFWLGSLIPKMPNILLDIFVRSSLTTLVYGFAIIYFNISDDINEVFWQTLKKIGWKSK